MAGAKRGNATGQADELPRVLRVIFLVGDRDVSLDPAPIVSTETETPPSSESLPNLRVVIVAARLKSAEGSCCCRWAWR